MTDAPKHKATRSDPALTPVVRLVYIYAHEKRTKDGTGKPMDFPRYEMNVLVPKLHVDPAQCSNYTFLAKHCMDACMKQPGWGGFPAGGHWPIINGDDPPKAKAPAPGVAPVDPAIAAAKYAYRKGHWVIEVNSYSDVGPRVCVMQAGQAVEIPARIIAGKVMYKSGDYGHVSLHAYTFHNKTWGVKFGFEGVLFTAEGEAIGSTGGPRAASAMFGGIAPMAPGLPTGAAPPPVAPAIPTFAPVAPGTPPFSPPGLPAPPAPPTAPAPAMAPVAPTAAYAPPGSPVTPPPVAPPVLPPFPTPAR